jgi:hypothetical protein
MTTQTASKTLDNLGLREGAIKSRELVNGIAWITDTCEGDERSPDMTYRNEKGELLAIFWGPEDQRPDIVDGVPDIDGWLKLDLPNAKRY